jgi:hypothetical protein
MASMVQWGLLSPGKAPSGKKSRHSRQCAPASSRTENKRGTASQRYVGDNTLCKKSLRAYFHAQTIVDCYTPRDTGLYARFLSTKEVGSCNFCKRPSTAVWVLKGAVTPIEARVCYLCMQNLFRTLAATNRK